jgi:hypothetical protein
MIRLAKVFSGEGKMKKHVYPSSIHPDIFFRISRIFPVYANTSFVFQNAQLKGDIHFGDERGSFFVPESGDHLARVTNIRTLNVDNTEKKLIQKAKRTKK